jgi:hypothetical protein
MSTLELRAQLVQQQRLEHRQAKQALQPANSAPSASASNSEDEALLEEGPVQFDEEEEEEASHARVREHKVVSLEEAAELAQSIGQWGCPQPKHGASSPATTTAAQKLPTTGRLNASSHR